MVEISSSAPARLPFAPRDLLVGRERETAEVLAMLARPDLACLTIVGPGGVGKTRLVQHVAAALASDPREPFAEGIWFVPLATVADAERAPAAIATALGLETGDEPPLDSVTNYLREREALLVLDNVEQIIDIAESVARIAGGCRDVKIIVTSRRPLRITGEQEYSLAPLPLPEDVGEIAGNPAVTLFVQRAAMINPRIVFDERTLASVAEICRDLDGLPLAIELAASRTKALSPAALLSQLNNRLRLLTGGPRDAPARQQAMRATIDWSYDLLTEDERAIFRRVSIFRAPFSLALVESLTAKLPMVPASDPLEAISALVDHSLIHATGDTSDDPRWTMLETIREFGREQAAAGGEAGQLRQAHTLAIAELADAAETGMYGVDQPAWIRRLTAVDDDVRYALTWAIERNDRELALRIAGPLWRYWSFRHLGNEGRSWLARTLAMPGEATPRTLGIAYRGAGCLAEDIGDYASAERHHLAALEIWRTLDDPPRISRALDDLGNVAHDQGEFERAISLHNEALAVARACGNRRAMTSALSNLGAAAYLQGDLEAARERWQAAIDSGAIDDPVSRAMVLNNLGVACMHLGDLAGAIDRLGEALAIHRDIGTLSTTADVFINMSDVATRQGDREQARAYFDEAIALYRRADDPKGLHNAYYSLGCEEVERGNGREALSAFAESLKLADRANNRLGMADAIEQIVSFTVETAHAKEGARLLGAARAIRSRLNSSELPDQRKLIDSIESELKRVLGEPGFAAAIAAGAEVSPRQALARALTLAESLGEAIRAPAIRRSTISTAPPLPVNTFKLTKREIEVLRLLSEGKTDRDIAAALWISPRTAGTHVANILGKLDVDTRAAAVGVAFRHNLI